VGHRHNPEKERREERGLSGPSRRNGRKASSAQLERDEDGEDRRQQPQRKRDVKRRDHADGMVQANCDRREPGLERRPQPRGKLPRERPLRLVAELVLRELDDLIVLVGTQRAVIAPGRDEMKQEYGRDEHTRLAVGQRGRQDVEP